MIFDVQVLHKSNFWWSSPWGFLPPWLTNFLSRHSPIARLRLMSDLLCALGCLGCLDQEKQSFLPQNELHYFIPKVGVRCASRMIIRWSKSWGQKDDKRTAKGHKRTRKGLGRACSRYTYNTRFRDLSHESWCLFNVGEVWLRYGWGMVEVRSRERSCCHVICFGH